MTSIPPGWYPDPAVPALLRYWDGRAWTLDQRATVSPLDLPLRAPEGTPWNTVWIWLVVLLPVVPLLLTLFVPWGSLFDTVALADPQSMVQGQLALFTSPAFLLSQLLSYAVFGLTVWFAYLDWRELGRRGVPQPFPWGWAFLNPVYPIGRSVVVVRRTGRGWAPMWAAIAVMAVSIGISVVITVTMLAGMTDMMRELMTTVPR